MRNSYVMVKKDATAQAPQSAHATPVVEEYVEKRKEKADEQQFRERKTLKLSKDEWKKNQYNIL